VLTALEAASAELTPGQAAPDWIQQYGSRNKDCLEWSDTCVNCVRAQSGENFSCSNIGIACQPKEVRCNSVPMKNPNDASGTRAARQSTNRSRTGCTRHSHFSPWSRRDVAPLKTTFA
jgi:hypothetical protein